MNPQWDKGWADLGALYYATGKFPQAIAALKNSIAINPKNSQAWAFLGLTEFETKDYSNAYIHLDRARELDFRGTPAVMLLAIYHLAELRNLNGDFFGAADLLIPEVHQGRVNEQTKIILGMSMLRVPLLPAQLSPSSHALMHAAGETAVLQYSYKYDDTFRAFERMTKDFPIHRSSITPMHRLWTSFHDTTRPPHNCAKKSESTPEALSRISSWPRLR